VKKIALGFCFGILLFILSTGKASASFVTVTRDGKITWNVLASSNIEVKSTAVATDTSALSLRTESGKFYLNNIDVTSIDNQDLINIEERADVKKIVIGVSGEQFSLNEGGVTALTLYPIKIDAKDRNLSVKTSAGETFLTILPNEAVETAVRSRFITKNSRPINISDFKDEIVYKVDGEKVFDFFGIVSYSVPVTAYVSVANGKIVNVAGPEWFKVFGFLFV
jgi:hypothetical protein